MLSRDYDLMLYEYDGSIDKVRPLVVVFPRSAEEVSRVVRLCNRFGLAYTARGAGTGLSGGALPVAGGVLISLARMNRILEIDVDNLRAVVEPGVVNLRLGQAMAAYGLTYVPDPSSQKACTIGGNVGENSGGPHTLRYGVTTNHTLGLEVVLPSGDVVQVGGKAPRHPRLRPGRPLHGLGGHAWHRDPHLGAAGPHPGDGQDAARDLRLERGSERGGGGHDRAPHRASRDRDDGQLHDPGGRVGQQGRLPGGRGSAWC